MRAKLVSEYLNTDTYYEEHLYESINEGINLSQIKEYISKISDKEKTFKNLIQKFNKKENSINIKKNIGIALLLIYFISLGIKNNKWRDSNEFNKQLEKGAIELAQKPNIEVNDIKLAASFYNQNGDFRNPNQLQGSNDAINLIKKHEGLKLKAYSIGDGKITIGYGHAEPLSDSNFKIGDKISKEQAIQLFNNDLKKKEEGLQRMFRQWKERGSDIMITQSMYDALLSMSFNMGISALRNSEFIEDVEDQNFQAAADKIPTTRVSNKFPGLEDRREDEYNLFIRDMT